MEPLILKKSCDACTSSKVKCNGGLPCERCVQKGVQCYFSPRKRRTKPKKPKTESDEKSRTSYVFDPSTPQGSLVEWERRSWSVFFTLYKHYGTSCSLHWFNRQLNKMRNYLSKQGNEESLRRLTSWMSALNIDVDTLAAEVEKCRVKCLESRRNLLTLRVQGTVNSPRESQATKVTARLKETSEKVPFLKVVSQFPNHYMRDEEENVTVTCNSAFTDVFGIEQKALEEQLRWTGGGFLPWGGDLLARLLTKEKDVLSYVQILAIKFNTLGKPVEYPNIRDIPSCHMFEVNIREKASSGRLIPVNALVKCMHREILSDDKFAMEISMEFTPLAPHEHLLSKTMLQAPATVGSCYDTMKDCDSTCKLNILKDVVPFPTKSNIRKRSLHNDFNSPEGKEQQDELGLGQMPSFDDFSVLDDAINGVFDLPNDAFAPRTQPFGRPSSVTGSVSVPNSPKTFGSKQNVIDNAIQEGLKDFASTSTISRNSVHIQTQVARKQYEPAMRNEPTHGPSFGGPELYNPLDDTGVQPGDQAEWLDGLLDWANKQDLPVRPANTY